MDERSFGSTDLKVSALGLGTGRLGATLKQGTDRDSVGMLLEALDSGITFYDTADSYGQGKSEELIGRAFKGRRDQLVIATKTGYRLSSAAGLAARLKPVLRPVLRSLKPLRRVAASARSSQMSQDFSPAHVNQAIEGSLRRLQTDHVDLYQLHSPPTAALQEGEVFAALEALRAAGKIRYYGVSCLTVEDAVLALKHPGVAAVQVTINLLEPEAIDTLLPLARERGVAVVARQPLAGGLLAQSEAEILAQATGVDREQLRRELDAAAAFGFLASGSRTLVQAAIQFVLGQDGVSVTLPGISSSGHLREAVGALEAPPLTGQELARIEAV
jgi:aryl-alcohol dehydrogenase-like predicted oxidoreductase